MISADGEKIICDEDDCENFIKNHRWGKTKADGWFFAKLSDLAYCPDHIPDWVPAWRKRKGNDARAD